MEFRCSPEIMKVAFSKLHKATEKGQTSVTLSGYVRLVYMPAATHTQKQNKKCSLVHRINTEREKKSFDLARHYRGINCQAAPSYPAKRVSTHSCMYCPGYHLHGESIQHLPVLCMNKCPFGSYRPWALPY